MNDIGKGDWVRCIEEDATEGGRVRVRVGEMHIVADVVDYTGLDSDCSTHGARCPQTGLVLEGVKVPTGETWCLACFTKAGPRGLFDPLLVCEELEDA